MSFNESNLHDINRYHVWEGFKKLVPLSTFVIIFGMAFGLAASQEGLDNQAIIFMSAFVFAGASQFASLELWGEQVSLIPLIITVFVINSRHLLMGAALYTWLRHLSPIKRYGVMLVASDANWAMSMRGFSRGEPALGLLVGGGLALWLFWVFGTWIGLYFGSAIHDPVALGLDMVMGCFLLAMVVEGDKDLRMLLIWSVSAFSSLMAYWYLPENTHIVVGALAGGILGALWMEKKQ